MLKYFVIIFFLLIDSLSALSQQYITRLNIDSLKKVLLAAKDTQRVNTLNLLSTRYLYKKGVQNDPASAQYYADEAMALAKSVRYSEGIGNALLNKGILDRDTTSALSLLQAALPLLKTSKDRNAVAFCFESIAEVIHTRGDNKTSILYRDSAQNLFKQLGDTSSAIWNISYKGHSYFDMGNYVKAYIFGEEAWELTKKNDTLHQTLTLAHLANLFLGAGLPK